MKIENFSFRSLDQQIGEKKMITTTQTTDSSNIITGIDFANEIQDMEELQAKLDELCDDSGHDEELAELALVNLGA